MKRNRRIYKDGGHHERDARVYALALAIFLLASVRSRVFTTFRARRRGNGSPPAPYNFTRRVLGYAGQLFLHGRCIRLTRIATPSMRRFSTRPERRSPRNSYPPER